MKNRNRLSEFIIITLIVVCGFISCNTTEPPDPPPPPPPPVYKDTITVTVEDVTHRSITVNIKTTVNNPNSTIKLFRIINSNEAQVSEYPITVNDTCIIDDNSGSGLQLNTTYTYYAVRIDTTGIRKDSSNIAEARTQDTTSQNFSFEFFEFGDGVSSSYFNDVWIFNENDIWVCGNVFTNDSTDGNLYHWNGSYWNAHRLNFVDMEGIWGIDTIMYLASGGLWKYDRVNLIRQNIEGTFSQGQAVHKLWGSSESNIYGVGPWGTIVWYNGVQWTKIEFDTQWSFFGITGNKETGLAYAVAMNTNFSCLIVELNNSLPNIIYNSDNYINKLKSYDVDMIRKDVLILSDSDIWTFNIKTQTDEILADLPSGYYLPRLTSSGSNDVYFFGNKLQDGERMLHYNGVRVTTFDLPSRGYVIYGGACSVNNLAAMAAFSDNKAYIIKIRRE